MKMTSEEAWALNRFVCFNIHCKDCIVFENGDCQYAKYASGHNETGMFKVLREHPEFVEQRKVRLPLDYETIRKKARI